MSAQEKRKFKMKAFKHQVDFDTNYAENTWKVLEHAIHEIYNHNASGLNFEELYRNAYSMVLHKYGEKLYTGLVNTMTGHLKEIAKSIEAAQGGLFLKELNVKWGDHNKALQMIRQILMYMDRTFVPSSCKTPVHEDLIYGGIISFVTAKSRAGHSIHFLTSYIGREQVR